MKKLFTIALLVTSIILFPSCGAPASKSPRLSQNRKAQETPNEGVVINYGNGLYFFNCTESDFGNNLSAFIKSNPKLKVTSMTGDGNGTYGRDTGYWVVTEERK